MVVNSPGTDHTCPAGSHCHQHYLDTWAVHGQPGAPPAISITALPPLTIISTTALLPLSIISTTALPPLTIIRNALPPPLSA